MKNFRDSKFMSASEKMLVLKQWGIFIKSGFEWKNFTDRLYKHLHLHCSFIAHYNRHGFYQTYFENPEDTVRFVSQFDSAKGCLSVEYGWDLWLRGEYSDLNKAMCETTEPYKASIYERCRSQERTRDLCLAHTLLQKHGVSMQGRT